jgi:hypothetical protein
MTFSFRPAVRERTSLLIGIAGASSSGKTYTALSIAQGLAGPDGKIAMIDTEAGRALHYADQFNFDHGDMKPPFSPDRYKEAIKAADDAGYDVIIIDSFSHEYEGEGGIIEWADRLAESGVKSPGNWKEPKTAHKKMVGKLLQCRAHLIFCLRAEEKMLMEQVAITNPDGSPKIGRNGKQIMATNVIPAADRPINERWQPICEKRFPYELTVNLLLLPSNPGIPIPLKLQEQHRPAFPEGQHAGKHAGEVLRQWAIGAKPSSPAADPRETVETKLPKFTAENEEDWVADALAAMDACAAGDGDLATLWRAEIWPTYQYLRDSESENAPTIWDKKEQVKEQLSQEAA